MTAYHVLYIPAVLLFGIFLGTLIGRDQMRREVAERQRRAEARETRREELRAQVERAEAPDRDEATERAVEPTSPAM
jgi:hypothetical protein